MAATRSVVLGTAGHIDHGKTSLVRALTGHETDRLPEEKKRGITIELGFAAWKINRDFEASIVDMPGHEAFVRTMVAGAGGLDAVMFVISAEDGVMPQTREHLEICSLLGLSRGLVAMTKIDLLEGDEDSIELAKEDIRDALANTPFEDAEIIPCSAHSGEGIDTLKKTLVQILRTLPQLDSRGAAVLPIDRAFTLRGHGTVITGTLMEGELKLPRDENLRHIPIGEHREAREVRVRGMQVRGKDAPRSVAGTRTSLNLGGASVDEFHRGDVLTRGDRVVKTSVFHIRADHLPHGHMVWESGGCLQICAGTAAGSAHIEPLFNLEDPDRQGRISITAGQAGVLRIRLDEPIPIWRGQRVILRAFSAPHSDTHGLTVGGGTVIDPLPHEGRGQRFRWIALAKAQLGEDRAAELVQMVQDNGEAGLQRDDVQIRLGECSLVDILKSPSVQSSGILSLSNDRILVDSAVISDLSKRIIAAVDEFQQKNPLQPGMGRAEALSKCPPRTDAAVAQAALDHALDSGEIMVANDQGVLTRPGKGKLDPDALPPGMAAVLQVYKDAQFEAPTYKQVVSETALDPKKVMEILSLLQASGLLVRLTNDISYAKQTYEKLLDMARKHLAEAGELDVKTMKTLTGLSRKYCVPIMEHFDRVGVTIRRGDTRYPGPKAKLE